MIVKFGQTLEWKHFKRRNRHVKALRMIEDFMFETQHGWVQGYKGQWIVEFGEGLRCNLDDQAFVRSHQPISKGKTKT